MPKPHFSAHSQIQASGKAASAGLLQSATGPAPAGPPTTTSNPAFAGTRRVSGRASLAPGSRVPRASLGGASVGMGMYQPFAMPGMAAPGKKLGNMGGGGKRRESGSGLGLTAQEIDERISRAVEAEVERRMKEKTRDWEAEQKRQLEIARREATAAALAAAAEVEADRSRGTPDRDPRDMSLPSGVLTPILKKHRDLDDELKSRLAELEKKL